MYRTVRNLVAAVALTLGIVGAALGVSVATATPADAAKTPCMYSRAAGLPTNVLTCYGARATISNSFGKVYRFRGHTYRVYSASASVTAGWLDGRLMICSSRLAGQCRWA